MWMNLWTNFLRNYCSESAGDSKLRVQEAAMTQFDTRSVHAGRDDLAALGVHVPPIDLSTTYPLPDVNTGGASYDSLAEGRGPDGGSLVYQRLWNPTVARFEVALAELEHTDGAVAFGSGMAALTACLLAGVAAGRPHVVAVRPLYGGSDHLLSTGLLGTTVTYTQPSEVAGAIRPDTGLVIVETPANPTLALVDIAAVAAAAGDVPVLVDNTFATPVLQQPARHGASLVLHSATKYLGGHGDVMGGVVAAGAEWVGRLRQIRAVTGACCIRWRRTNCTGDCRRCRFGYGRSRQPQSRSPTGCPHSRWSTRSTTRAWPILPASSDVSSRVPARSWRSR
jgi:methionine-gamma-lyase